MSVTPPSVSTRIASIDILRALTMVLMIFVNDLWSLNNIPDWLGHVERGVDGMGLADTIFPAFLFIVGMSLPFAIRARRKQGATPWQLVQHVLVRTVALLAMGVFLVNGESINAAAMPIPRWLWNPLCCIAFILIWNSYPKTLSRSLVYGLKGLGIATLLVLAVIYRGGTPETLQYFAPKWWGILGLIGWSYLASALVVILSGDRLAGLLIGWLLFAVLSLCSAANLIPTGGIFSLIPHAILGGTLPGLAMGGVLTAVTFRHYQKQQRQVKMTLIFILAAAVLVALAGLTRPYWGIAKLGETPAWLFLCSAITLLAFVVIYWIADGYGKQNWFNLIRPAGTDTLLCYLIPYLLYALFRLVNFRFPPELLTGAVGLAKSLALAMCCVFITHGLNKAGIRLKL
ncbi:heparan-alpha-glucosaminide N-acetyltransferase domain-containing protein [Parapedobacter lycopersici]|uniref:heparan-alpha-glucosaminide N-acetyltransferase domain-containing protein n=1 Tax=Parapedobacter lycopersici TaxID=1864939 RepID=UPI00214D4B24|nr:DUF5009 domain-containing protein [Parapedobacter lycopersici]